MAQPPAPSPAAVVDLVALQVGGPLPRPDVADVATVTGLVVRLVTSGAEERAVDGPGGNPP